jgi:hypothetical protein
MNINYKKDSILTLIKMDSDSLYQRVKHRYFDYMQVFTQKRTRDHFQEIFIHKFKSFPLEYMVGFEKETIMIIYQFYNTIDELFWYLQVTQDMPNTVEDRVSTTIRNITPMYENIKLYIESELDQQSGNNDMDFDNSEDFNNPEMNNEQA